MHAAHSGSLPFNHLIFMYKGYLIKKNEKKNILMYLLFLQQDCLCSALLGVLNSLAGAALDSRTDGESWSSRPSAAAGNIYSPLGCCGQCCGEKGERIDR